MRWFIVALGVLTFGLVCGVIGFLIGDARNGSHTTVRVELCQDEQSGQGAGNPFLGDKC